MFLNNKKISVKGFIFSINIRLLAVSKYLKAIILEFCEIKCNSTTNGDRMV